MTFESLGLPEPLSRAVADAGYATPTPVQAAAIPPALADIHESIDELAYYREHFLRAEPPPADEASVR